jgi:hypothetical protein
VKFSNFQKNFAWLRAKQKLEIGIQKRKHVWLPPKIAYSSCKPVGRIKTSKSRNGSFRLIPVHLEETVAWRLVLLLSFLFWDPRPVPAFFRITVLKIL